MRPYRVYAIDNGTVIDHITNGQALRVVQILRLSTDSVIAVGMNFESKKLGKKDIVKVENLFLEDDMVNKIGLIAPEATVNIIRDGKLVSKHAIQVPRRLLGIMRCTNPRCITNHEEMTTRFDGESDGGSRGYRCHYCERIIDSEAIGENLL